MERFDVIVIGGGPAGENVAGRCRDCGASIAVVEVDLLGGECSYWACLPSKTLLRPGEVLAEVGRVPGAAAAMTGALDADAVFAWRDDITAHWRDDSQAEWLDGAGGVLVRGHGRLVSERRIDVELPDGGGVRELEAGKAVVVATGSAAVVPPIDGLREIETWDSRAATSARRVPDRLLVLGGGVVGVEMAQAWKRLGTREVTVVDMAPRLVTQFEPFASGHLQDAFADEGIEVVLEASVERAARDGGGPVTLTLADGRTVTADELLVATGRRPNTSDVGLDAIGLEPGRPVAVDDQLRATGVEGGWLYAIGDCNGRTLLTHMGKYQARIAADAILYGVTTEAWADHRAVPSVVFTDPQLAMVGLTEAKAREQGIGVKVVTHGTGDVAGASVHGRGITGTSQLVVDDARRVIVGATFTGPGVGELLHAATIAVAGEVPLDTLWHAVPSFPTMSEVWLRLLEAYGL
jgi:dihydrolipoamide dehydrogenase